MEADEEGYLSSADCDDAPLDPPRPHVWRRILAHAQAYGDDEDDDDYIPPPGAPDASPAAASSAEPERLPGTPPPPPPTDAEVAQQLRALIAEHLAAVIGVSPTMSHTFGPSCAICFSTLPAAAAALHPAWALLSRCALGPPSATRALLSSIVAGVAAACAALPAAYATGGCAAAVEFAQRCTTSTDPLNPPPRILPDGGGGRRGGGGGFDALRFLSALPVEHISAVADALDVFLGRVAGKDETYGAAIGKAMGVA